MLFQLLAIIALPLLSASMFILLRFGWRIAKKYNFTSTELVSTVFFFSIFKVVFYYAIPVLFGLFSGFQYLYQDGYSVIEWAELYAIEATSWIFWLIGFLCIASLKKNKLILLDYADIAYRRASASKLLLVSIVVFSIPYSILNGGYISDIDYGLPPFFELFKSLLIYGVGPASILLVVLGLTRWSKFFLVIGSIGVFNLLATFSTRGAFIYSFFFLVILGFFFAVRKKKFLFRSCIVFFAITLLYLNIGGLPQLALVKDSSLGLALEASFGKEKKQNRSALEEIEWRFGAPSRMSIAFIKMYNRGFSAGINPIKHSFLGFLPRSLNDRKPIPSTVDPENIYSQGMYLIYRETYGYNTFSMVEFSSGGHAYWEFGILGVIVLPLIAGVYIALCAYYFQYFGVASLALIMVVFKPFGYVDPKIWVSDIVMQLYQIILPLCFLSFLWYLFGKMMRSLLMPTRR